MIWPFKSRYVQLLETENERLHVENRALLNRLLGAGGFKSVESVESTTPPAIQKPPKPKGWHNIGRMMRGKGTGNRYVLDLVPEKAAASGKDAVRP